jgi:hypothetical protein
MIFFEKAEEKHLEKYSHILLYSFYLSIGSNKRDESIEFNGVNSFRERVYHGVPNYSSSIIINKLVNSIETKLKNLNRVGLIVNPGNNINCNVREYQPHMTICKLSRPLQRRGIHTIPSSWYDHTSCHFLDDVALKSIYLCEMKKPTNKNGFYTIISTGKGIEYGDNKEGKKGAGSNGDSSGDSNSDRNSGSNGETKGPSSSTTTTSSSTIAKSPPPLVFILRGVSDIFQCFSYSYSFILI